MRPMFGEADNFLTSVLSSRGPDAVPYAEHHKYTIRDHVSELIKQFPSLVLKVDRYTTPDGRTLNILKADGTVPMHYQGVKYNIPVMVLLPEKYPLSAPMVYVVPTPSMVVKPNHPFVDYSTGMVSTPCLRQWLHPSSTLLDAVTEMSIWFGQDPPLFARSDNTPPAPQSVRPPVDNYQQTFHNPMQQGGGGSSSYSIPPPTTYGPSPSNPYPPVNADAQSPLIQPHGGSGSYNPYGLAPYTSAGQQQQPQASPSLQSVASQMSQVNLASYGSNASPAGPTPEQQRTELEKVFRDVAVKALTTRLSAVAAGYYQKVRDELGHLTESKKQLLAHSQQLQQGIKSVQDERMAVEALVKELASKAQQINKWLEDNEWKVQQVGSTEVDPDRIIQPTDAGARQQMQQMAEDMALEDMMDELDRAHLDGKIPADVYIKQVRQAARKQFYARAITSRISGQQRPAMTIQTPGASTMQGRPPPAAPNGPMPSLHQPYPSLPSGFNMFAGIPPIPPPPQPGFNTGILNNPLAGR